MAGRNVELDLATALATNAAELTLGTNCFAGPVRPVDPRRGIPGECVFVLQATTGAAPLPMRGTDVGTGPDQLRAHRVQFFVRSAHEDYAGGEVLARSVRDGICYRAPTGYHDVVPVQAKALYLGQDDKGHHEWSLNVDALTEETTA